MQILDRLLSSSKKEKKQRQSEEGAPDTPTADRTFGTLSDEEISPNDKFQWSIRRKRKESSHEETVFSQSNTPQHHEVYLEEDNEIRLRSKAERALPQTKPPTTPVNPNTTKLTAKALFASPAHPLSVDTSAATAETDSCAGAAPLVATLSIDSDEWDYNNDIPLYVDEENEQVIQKILMQPPTPKDAVDWDRSKTNKIYDEKEHNQISRAIAALDKAGNALFALGRYEDAFLRYERALLLKRRTLTAAEAAAKGVDPSSLKISQVSLKAGNNEQKATILASVATSINNITYIKQRTGQATSEETMASYLKSLQIKREILGPDHLSVGKTLNNIGSVFYLKKEYVPALTAYKDAHRIMLTKLGSKHLDVGTVISNIGDVYFALDQNDAAMVHYNRALDIRWSKLGPNDPKVIRLMNQVALLQTGAQPNVVMCAKQDDPDEAEIIREMERHQMSVFIEDIQKLQKEVQDDIRYFDLAERQFQIDLVKERMRIFREMRDLYNAKDDFNIEDSLRESMKVIPGLADQLKKVQNHEYDDVYDEMGADAGPLQQTGDDVTAPRSETAARDGNSEAEVKLHITEQSHTHSSNMSADNVVMAEVKVETPTRVLPTPRIQNPKPSQSLGGRMLSNVKERVQLRSRKSSKAQGGTVGVTYSPDERRAALEGVRERLERLRREREQRAGGRSSMDADARNDSREHNEAPRRSYMFPTIASAAKSMAPNIKKFRRVQRSGSFKWNNSAYTRDQTPQATMSEESTP